MLASYTVEEEVRPKGDMFSGKAICMAYIYSASP